MKPDQFDNIPQAFVHQVKEDAERELYSQSVMVDDRRVWVGATNSEVCSRVAVLAEHLRSVGVTKGSKVAIVSNTRPEWLELDLAILCCGGTVISVYQSLLAHDIAYILFDSDSDIVIAENQEQIDKLEEIVSSSILIPATEDREAQEVSLKIKSIVALEEVKTTLDCKQYQEIIENAEEESFPNEAWYSDCTQDDIAALVYTSGTTGPPKGVIQTHGNHLANARQVLVSKLISENDSMMLFLPLAHSFAKLIGYLGFLTRARLKFASVASKTSSKLDAQAVTTDIRLANATVIPMVPRILEKMRNGVITSSKSSGFAAKLLKLALWSANKVRAAKEAGKSAGLLAQIAYAGTGSIREKVKKKLFGDNFVFALSGGAKLPVEVSRFFESLEMEILEGYGLTETCVATNANRIGIKKIGSVGPVLDSDIEVKISEEGEILYRGPNITQGYYNRPTATSDSWDSEGWFHTGDLGEVDEDDYLYITGRKKDLIVTAGGKKVAPQGIEERLVAFDLISQVVMLGDAKPYCIALVTLDKAAVKTWAANNNIGLDGEYKDNQALMDRLWLDIQGLNEDLASFETIKKIAIIEEEFSVENGLLTPSFKIKRAAVQKQYQDLFESLY